MKQPVSAQELSDMLSHAIQPTSLPSYAVKCQKVSVIYGEIARFGRNVISVMQGISVMNGDPFKTSESLRQDMVGLQNLVIELSNVGFINKAGELATDLAYIEREFGQLYLQNQETQG